MPGRPDIGVIVLLMSTGAVAAQDDPVLRELVRVERVLLDVRALDSRGRPISDLKPADLLLQVDGVEVAVESLDWIDGSRPDLSGLPAGAVPPSWEGAAEGRLVVLFFQRDLSATRLKGLMRMTDLVAEFVAGLRPQDRVALVVHDTGLLIYSDFTTDRERTAALLSEAVVRQMPPPPVEAGRAPSLVRNIDPQAAAAAAAADQGLLLLATALDALPGSKTLIYIGWSMNRRLGTPSPALGQAAGLMIHGRVTMFSLDVTDADYHTLEGPLFQTATETGGFYLKTHVFSELAMDRVEYALAGHYELSFIKPELPAGRHVVELSMRDRKGQAYHRRFYDD